MWYDNAVLDVADVDPQSNSNTRAGYLDVGNDSSVVKTLPFLDVTFQVLPYVTAQVYVAVIRR